MEHKAKIVSLFQKGSCSCVKTDQYLQAVQSLAREIRTLGEQHGFDSGNVLTDVIYYAVAMDLAEHTNFPDS